MGPLLRFSLSAVLPASGDLPGVSDCGLKSFIQKFRSEAPFLFKLGLYLSTLALTFTPLFTVFIPLPAFLLPKRMLEAHLMGMTRSRIYGLRQAMLMVKTVAGMCWGADPKVRAALGLDPYGEDPGTWRTD